MRRAGQGARRPAAHRLRRLGDVRDAARASCARSATGTPTSSSASRSRRRTSCSAGCRRAASTSASCAPPVSPVEAVELTPLAHRAPRRRAARLAPAGRARRDRGRRRSRGEPFVFFPRTLGASLYEDVLARLPRGRLQPGRRAGGGRDADDREPRLGRDRRLAAAGRGRAVPAPARRVPPAARRRTSSSSCTWPGAAGTPRRSSPTSSRWRARSPPRRLARVTWPDRPRVGSRSVPPWLLILVIAVAVAAFLALLILLVGHDPDCNAGYSC